MKIVTLYVAETLTRAVKLCHFPFQAGNLDGTRWLSSILPTALSIAIHSDPCVGFDTGQSYGFVYLVLDWQLST